MTEAKTLSKRTFERADQEAFADLSGDRNPIHLDPLAARRTIAGAPIVHGIHGLLWALDTYRPRRDGASIAAISATFLKMLYLGDRVRLVVQDEDAEQARLQLVIDEGVATRIKIGFGARGAPGPALPKASSVDVDTPLEPDFAAMATMAGFIRHRRDAGAATRLFPEACAAIGAERVLGLATSSTVVGMVCPGLHSIYDSIEVRLVEGGDGVGLGFATREAQERFGRLRLALEGSGLSGSLVTFKRPAPAVQPTMATLAAAVTPGEFAGVSALVVGGSRGLGELVGKLIAAGGGESTITFRHGEADAVRVAAEIAAAGGRCHVARYDVEADAAAQLAACGRAYTQMYYLATPPIFDKRGLGYDSERLRLYVAYYVDAFYRLAQALAERGDAKPAIFYPSSVAVETRPKQLTEYAMAKAAGEVLCADMQRFEKFGTVVMRRLPRLATDQTASIQATETEDATTLMREIVRAMTADGVRR